MYGSAKWKRALICHSRLCLCALAQVGALLPLLQKLCPWVDVGSLGPALSTLTVGVSLPPAPLSSWPPLLARDAGLVPTAQGAFPTQPS